MEKEVLTSIVEDIYNIKVKDFIILDKIIDNYTNIVHQGFKDDETHIIGQHEGQIVSIEKKGLTELYDIINQLFN